MRELYKQCVLATHYGQGVDGLANRIGQPPAVARELLRQHREEFQVFWRWSDAAIDLQHAKENASKPVEQTE